MMRTMTIMTSFSIYSVLVFKRRKKKEENACHYLWVIPLNISLAIKAQNNKFLQNPKVSH